MRKTLFALAATALMAGAAIIGCGGDNTSVPGDMAHSDGPIISGDMAVVKVGCNGFVQCLNDCFQASMNATLDGCETMCAKTAKSTAPAKFASAFKCGQDFCLGDQDAMTGKCKISDDMTMLINLDGTAGKSTDPKDGSNPQKACFWCLNDALAGLFGDTCTSMSSPNCNPATCASLDTACLSDMP